MNKEDLKQFVLDAEAAGDYEAAEKALDRLAELKEYVPPQGGTIFDALGQGAMLGFSDEIAGVVGAIPAAIQTGNWDLGEHYTGIRDAARANEAAFSERNPKTALAAEVGGGLLTGGAGGARLAGLKGAQLVKGSGLLGAGYGAASGAGHSEGETLGEVAKDAAVGGAVGGLAGMAFPAAGQALAKGKRAAQSAMNPSKNYTKAVDRLKREGIDLTGGQQRGSNWQKTVEDQLGDTPLIGTNIQRVHEGQRAQFQKGLLRQLGVDEGDGLIDASRADEILDDLSKEYGKALRGKFIDIADDTFIDDLARIESKHTQIIDDPSERKVRSIIDKFLAKATEGAKKDGEWYQAQRSIFAKRAQGSSDTAGLYGDLVGALDDAFERLNPATKGNIDKRWSMAKQIQRVAQGGGADTSEGLLPLASLNRLAKTKPGTKDWKEYLNSGATVLPPRLGNSGTASRQMANDFIRGGLLSGLGVTNPETIPMMIGARMMATRMAKGGGLDATKLLPSGQVLGDPRLAQGIAANAGLLQ